MIKRDLRRIKCAKELQETANGAMIVAKAALSPRLKDVDLLPEIYYNFLGYLKDAKLPPHQERRREFLFIVFYLYCPSVLIGYAMPRGFRNKLKELLHVESPSAVSNYTTDLFFLYNHYADFREVVENAYNYIVEKMNLASKLIYSL